MAENAHPDTVLIAAPIGADAQNIQTMLARIGVSGKICGDSADFERERLHDLGAVVLTEEALTPEFRASLKRLFASQPAWSDIPVVLIASTGPRNFGPAMAADLRGPRRTITLLERPLRVATLLATLDTLLAGRHRQYEIRDLLHERDDLLSSLESRVAERTAELRGMVEEMEAFSYSVSHDLRSPLRSLAGFAHALKEDYGKDLPEGARIYCDKIERAAQRMDRLTQDVLAYTRVARGEMDIVSVDLDSLVAEVIEQYPAIRTSRATIRVEYPLGCVRGHVPSLIQCFSNLLGNAVKFVPADRAPVVRIWASLSPKRRRVHVKDNGVGIARSDQARIFQMFERAAGKDVPGTGIGLAIVRKAVERMGGTVGVVSKPDEGAEFWVELDDALPPCTATSKAADLATFWAETPSAGLNASLAK